MKFGLLQTPYHSSTAAQLKNRDWWHTTVNTQEFEFCRSSWLSHVILNQIQSFNLSLLRSVHFTIYLSFYLFIYFYLFYLFIFILLGFFYFCISWVNTFEEQLLSQEWYSDLQEQIQFADAVVEQCHLGALGGWDKVEEPKKRCTSFAKIILGSE